MDGDISAKLNDILSDKQKMSAVMSVVSSVMGKQAEEGEKQADIQMPRVNDDKINLLVALKPFLSADGREKADKLIKLLSLYSIAGQLKL